MSQIFCVRREATIGLAVLQKDSYNNISLMAIYPDTGDKVSDFAEALQALIEKYGVTKIWVSPLSEGEPSASELHEFRNVGDRITVRQVKSLIKPLSGRIARAELLKSGSLDESRHYRQSAKLGERIQRLGDRAECPPDLEAYLSGLILVESDSDELTDDSLGSVDPFCQDFTGYRSTTIGGAEYRQI